MKFSIIVPIYNVGEYLSNCITSILNQDFIDFELILVNDGSLDDSLYICQKFLEVDKRIKLINKPNGGLTSARKAGARIAAGDYVITIDGDDYIEQGYLSAVSKSLLQFNPDIIVLNYLRLENNNKVVQNGFSFSFSGLVEGRDFLELKKRFIYDFTDENISNPGIITYSLWCKVIRREIYIKAQELINDNVVIGEDLLCSLYCLEFSKSMLCLDNCFYVYRILDNSMMHKYSLEKFMHFENTIIALIDTGIVDDRRINAYAFHALCNEYETIIKSGCSLRCFISNVRRSQRYKLLYKRAYSIDNSNCNFKSLLKIRLVVKKHYLLLYAFFKLKNRKTRW